MPVPPWIAPLSTPCCRQACSRLAQTSSPSDNLTMTTLPSAALCIRSLLQERDRLDVEAPLHGAGQVGGVAEHGVDDARPAGLDEPHEVLEVRVVAERELGIQPVPAREVEEGAPPGHVRG